MAQAAGGGRLCLQCKLTQFCPRERDPSKEIQIVHNFKLSRLRINYVFFYLKENCKLAARHNKTEAGTNASVDKYQC